MGTLLTPALRGCLAYHSSHRWRYSTTGNSHLKTAWVGARNATLQVEITDSSGDTICAAKIQIRVQYRSPCERHTAADVLVD